MVSHLLITRDGEGADPYIRAAEKHGLTPLICPLYGTEEVAAALPEPQFFQAVILTSSNAVAPVAADGRWLETPVYCVGEQTADDAARQGFVFVHPALPNAEKLAELIAEECYAEAGAFLYARGLDIAFSMATMLEERGLKIEERIVYKTHPVLNEFETIRPVLLRKQVDYALFFSARAAKRFASLIQQKEMEGTLTKTKALCLGESMVECLSVLPFESVHVAPRPDRGGMLRLINILCKEESA